MQQLTLVQALAILLYDNLMMNLFPLNLKAVPKISPSHYY